MFKLITFLDRNKLLNFLIVTVYFLLVTLPHEWVGVKLGEMVQNMSRIEFNRIVLVIGTISLLVYLFGIGRNILKFEKKIIPIFYLILSTSLAIISLNLLIIVNVEIIHFVQYAILAILFFPLLNGFLLTLFLCMILGFIDEGYQFYCLPVRTSYFDFNDVVLDFIGAGFGLSILRVVPKISNLTSLKTHASKFVWASWLAILTLAAVLIKLGYLQVYSNGTNDDHWTTLVIKQSEGFWTKDPHGIFHVMSPLEGMICLTILLFIYQFINKDLETSFT